MTGFLQDLRYSLRNLWKSPGFAIAGVLALAFGIGINSMVFTLLNAVALRPLPVREASDLVTVYQIMKGARERLVHGSPNYLSYPEYVAYRDRNHSFQGMAAYASANLSLGGEEARRLTGQLATCNYFSVVSQGVALGRGFLEDECKAKGAGPVVVLSHSLWQQQFNGDTKILGHPIVLNGSKFTIVGIAPQGFSGASIQAADIWTPISMEAQWVPNRNLIEQANTSWLQVIGRLRPKVAMGELRADLSVIAAQIDQQNPGRTTTLSISRATLMNVPQLRTVAVAVGSIVLAAVSMVLLIACANLANLLLARAAARQKEIAVRLAVGASRLRLIRQLLTESVLVSVTGGGLGLLIAWKTIRTLYPFLLARLPEEAQGLPLNLTPDIRILVYSLSLSIVTALGFGLLPAIQASRVDLNSALKGVSGFVNPRSWFRSALVATQVAVCLVLLIATGLLTRGLYAAQTVSPGIDMKGVAVAGLDLSRQGYDETRAREFHRVLGERLADRFGKEQISLVDAVPLSGGTRQNLVTPAGKEIPFVTTNATVSPGYFQLLGIPIVQGRAFDEGDKQVNAASAIISESAARRFWPGESAVGKRFRLSSLPVDMNVIGVAKDIRASNLAEFDEAFVYYALSPTFYRDASVLVRAPGGYTAAAQVIREEVRALDPSVLVRINRLEDNPGLFQLPAKITAGLGVVLGVAGILLASLGIYGVASFAVARRTREIGIRMSLGADASHVLRMILWQSMRPVVIGMVFGLLASAAISTILSGLLFGVSPLDPLVFVTISLFLATVAFFASRAPALRAIRINPMAALRSE